MRLLSNHRSTNFTGLSRNFPLLVISSITLCVLLLLLLLNVQSAPLARAETADLNYYEQRIVELTNLKRAQFNSPPLRLNRELTVAARAFSQDSVVNRPGGYCGHQSTDGVYPDVRTKRAGYRGISGAENAYCGFGTPEAAVDAWFNEVPPNDGHRRNLLNVDSREIGIGYYLDISTGRGYIAQDFGQDSAYPPLVINADAPVTSSANVNLYIYGAMKNSDPLYALGQPVQMKISNQPDFNGANWEAYAATKSWTLDNSSGYGFKTVYVQLQDGAGKSTVSSDNIYYGPQIPYGNFDSLAQASTHLESLNISGLNNGSKGGTSYPYMQFSSGWELNSQSGNMSLNWGKGSLVSDTMAANGKAFQLQSAGANESNAWLYTVSYPHNLPSQVYFRLKLSNLNAPKAQVKLVVGAGGTETSLSLTAASFSTANTYQEFPINFTQPDNSTNGFLSFQVGFTDSDGASTLNIDRMSIYTAPETFSPNKTWQIPDKNYRGTIIKVRYTDNASASPGFFEPRLIGPFLPPVYNPTINIAPVTTTTAASTTAASTTPAVPSTTVPPTTTTPATTTSPSGSPSVTSGITPPPTTPVSNPGYPPTQPASEPDPAFAQLWGRTDEPVLKGLVSRSWMWGDKPNGSALLLEPYADKKRLVQYHDKSRMEVNNANGNRSDLFFVTNGLLVKELISGQMQISDSSFVTRPPADVPVAGDPENPNAPTYASFLSIASLNGDKRSQNRVGGNLTTALSRNGAPQELSGPPALVKLAYFDDNLGHNIAEPFWNFMNSRGLILANGNYVQDTVINWVYAMGYPISEPYWVRAKVGGIEKDILVQVFERRVLTYTPSNSTSFQVEMGNVGQHYYRWRYGSLPK